MTFNEAKSIPIPEYLSRLGFEPYRKIGVDYWYLSPFRNERDPSFKVNTQRNVWYDHGSGEGGTLIDLGSKLHSCSLHEFMLKLSAGNFAIDSKAFQQQLPIEPPEDKLYIISVKELTNGYLLHYLSKRGISATVAKTYCKEVEFQIRKKEYVAIGFLNRSGGYELRNPWIKRGSSPKDISVIEFSNDISLIENNPKRLCVLEGFVDFLSLIETDNKELEVLRFESSFIILNSLSFLLKNVELVKTYSTVNLFLDNDKAGHAAKHKLKLSGVDFFDASLIYNTMKDLNEFHIQAKVHTQRYNQSGGRKI